MIANRLLEYGEIARLAVSHSHLVLRDFVPKELIGELNRRVSAY